MDVSWMLSLLCCLSGLPARRTGNTLRLLPFAPRPHLSLPIFSPPLASFSLPSTSLSRSLSSTSLASLTPLSPLLLGPDFTSLSPSDRSSLPPPLSGPRGQLMLRRSGSWSGEAASMSICSLTMLMAVAAASSPLLPRRPPQRSSACCMSLTVSTPKAMGMFH